MNKNKNIKQSRPGSELVAIEMNNYVRPDTDALYYGFSDVILNGEDNSFFKFVSERYYGSATNKSVIDSYVNYIYGDGIRNKGQVIKEVLPNDDLRSIIQDYKEQGQCAIQVIYDLDRKVNKMVWIPISQVGIARDDESYFKPKNYWFCHNWELRTMFPPVLIPAFGTSNEGTELLVIRNRSSLPFFSLPDYQPCLQACVVEEELMNYTLSHILNGFSAGHIINVVKGLDMDLEAQKLADKALRSQMTGSKNAGRFFISYNDNPETKTTIESIAVADGHKQYEAASIEARDKILMAHRVTNPILFGVDKGSGFSNNAEEMVVALKTLYRSIINPMREQLIDGLESILKINDPNVNLNFEDFEELRIVEEETTTTIGDTTVEDNTKQIITE